MDERGRRFGRWVVLGLGTGALVGDLAVLPLVDSAVPYLPRLQVAVWPVVGALFALAALAVVRASRPQGAVALVLAAICLPSAAFAIGLAQRSDAWVVVGAADAFVLPSVLVVALASLRGHAALRQPAVRATTLVALVAAVTRAVAYDPGAWGWCRCTRNPLAVGMTASSYLRIQPWIEVLSVAEGAIVVIAVVQVLVRRPGRRGPAELLTAGAAMLVAATWTVPLVRSAAWPQLRTGTPAYVGAMALLVILGCGVVEALRQTPSRARVADLLLAAREDDDRGRLGELVARAVGDPEARVWWWDPEVDRYVDDLGKPLEDHEPLSGSRTMPVRSQDRPLALVVGSRPLPDDPRVLDPVAEALRLATENRWLAEELAASLEDVRESRQRILSASDEARKRIERDLHDGAQQMLIATAATLNLATAKLDDPDAELARTLNEATRQLGRALIELRNLAAGITPTALVHGSLVDAIMELALRSPVPAVVHVDGDRAPDLDTAVTAYFVVAESLSNIAKHANASHVGIDLALDDPLRVVVSDDGIGGADAGAGSGLRGLTDRVEVRGGTITLQSGPAGTRIAATLPLTDRT